MGEFERVEGFEWDAGNSRKNAEKHEVTQAEAEQIFFDARLLVIADDRHSTREARYHALGCTAHGRHLHVTFTLRDGGRLIRVVSARPMSRKERSRYAHKV